jgi:hypothetical protein
MYTIAGGKWKYGEGATYALAANSRAAIRRMPRPTFPGPKRDPFGLQDGLSRMTEFPRLSEDY